MLASLGKLMCSENQVGQSSHKSPRGKKRKSPFKTATCVWPNISLDYKTVKNAVISKCHNAQKLKTSSTQSLHWICMNNTFPPKIIFYYSIYYYNHPSLTFSADKKDLISWSKHETLPWTIAHPSGSNGRIQRSGRGSAGARLLAQATVRRRHGEATEQ